MDEVLRRARRKYQAQPDDLETAGAYIAALERSLQIEESNGYEISTTLVLATSHIPFEESQWIQANHDWVWAENEYCWIFWVAPDNMLAERIQHYPVNIGKLMWLARNLNCDFLRLDADGPVLENLPTWDW